MSRLGSVLARLQRSKLVRLMFGSSMLRAIGLGITLLTSVALARVLGPTGLGYYSFALAVVTVIGLPIHMGLPTLVLRETAKGEASENWGSIRALWSWAWRRITIISLLIFASAVPALWLFGDRFIPEGGMGTVWISLALIPLIAIAQVRGAAVRGLHRPILGLLPDTVVRPTGLVLLLILAWISGSTITAEGAMERHIIAALFASAVGIFFLYRVTPAPIKKASPDYAARPAWKSALWPLALLAGTQSLMQNASVLIVGLLAAPADVGYFKIAMSASSLATIGLAAVNMVISPTFVKLYSLGKFYELQRKVSQGSIMAVSVAIPLISILIIFGKYIIEFLYGPAFIVSYIPMVILLIGQFFSAFFGSCGILLTMSGHERVTLMVMMLALVLNVVLCLALTVPYGIWGAAVATAVTTLAWNLGLVIAIKKKLSITSTPFGLIKNELRRKPTT